MEDSNSEITFDIEVQTPFSVPEEWAGIIETAVSITLQQQKISPPAAVTLVLTDDTAVQQLNREYRAMDKPTDVLSFPAGEPMPGMDSPYLGDIIISVPFAERQARTSGHPPIAELQLLAVHGTLHLLGYDHADKEEKAEMWGAQTAVLTLLNLSRITPTEGT